MPDPYLTTSLLTTVIQIGIPSIVTIASLFATFKSTKDGHKKDVTIAEITLQGKSRAERNERKANLVKEIVSVISNVENEVGRHSGIFRRNTHSPEFISTAYSNPELQATFVDLSKAIDACGGTRTMINLLGDPNVSERFELFLQTLFGFQHQANPAVKVGTLELEQALNGLMEQRKILMAMLSAIYLEAA